MKFNYILSLVYLCISQTYADLKVKSIIDLTHTYVENYTPSHPKDSSFDLRLVQRGKIKPGVWYYSNDIFTGEHVGTHIDAPIHINEELHAIDEIPIEKLYRIPGVAIDVSEEVRENHNYLVKVKDIEEWIEKYGAIPNGAIVIFQTGWGRQATVQKVYTGVDAKGNTNFPGISEEAAEWIVMYKNSTSELNEGIIAVGIDTISLDAGNSQKIPAHMTLLEAGIYGVENMANTHELPATDFTITMLPMKVAKGSAAPTRIIAEINGVAFAVETSAAQKLSTSIMHVLLLLFGSRFL